MDKNRKTANILNVFQYDHTTGVVTLPSTLSIIAPAGGDNSATASTTAWVRTYISSLNLIGSGTLSTTDVTEGTRLYYTDARVGSYLTANSYATQTYVGTQIANLVASSPATLDTLNELASALGNDPNFATTVATSIGTKQTQLNGTGFVKASGTSITYDNSTYALDSVVVKLTGAQTIAGIKTFQDDIKASNFLYIREQNASTLLANHTQVYANSTYFGFTNGAGTGSAIFTYNGAFNYTLPSSAGTLALTSALASYLPLAGGTVTGVLSVNSALRIKSGSATGVLLETYSTNELRIRVTPVSTTFDMNLVFPSSSRTYTYPNATGTIALTSDIPTVAGVYLPLSGGTLTGPLNGTSAVFSGDLTSNGELRVSNNAGLTFLQLVNSSAGGRSFTLISSGASNPHGIAAGSFYLRNSTLGTNPLFIDGSTGAATFSSSVTASQFLASSSGNAAIITSTGTNGYGLLAVGSSGGARDILLAGQNGYSNGFTVQFTGAEMRYTFLDGNVGINRTNPVSRLEVSSESEGSGFTGITVSNWALNQSRAGIAFKAYDWVQSAIWHGRGISGNLGGALVFGTNPNTSNLSVGGVVGRMWLFNNGNVSVGNEIDSGAKLQVNGVLTASSLNVNVSSFGTDISVNSTIRVGSGFSTQASIIFGDAGTPYWSVGRPAGSGNFNISSYALTALTIQPTTGNVGLGISPSVRLHVNGVIGMGQSASGTPLRATLVKQGTNSITFNMSMSTIGAWRPGHATVRVSGGQNGLQEFWTAWFIIRLTGYFASGIGTEIMSSGGNTGSVTLTTSSNQSSPQAFSVTLTDSGSTTDTMIADIDIVYNEGILSLS